MGKAHVRACARHGIAGLVFLALMVVGGCGSEGEGERTAGRFRLTVLHNNDGESHLLSPGAGLEDFGGVARFAAVVKKLREEAQTDAAASGGVVMLSSGDNFLASAEFDASMKRGVPFFDSVALHLIGYDAIGIGNHEFDLGPDVLVQFIEGVQDTPFVSANLDFTNQRALRSLARQGRVTAKTVLDVGGERIGVVGATTPRLAYISRPLNVAVRSDLRDIIQAEIDELEAQGIDKIILLSHLQSISEDLELAAELRGLDVMVAGGGNELLANEGDRLLPDDSGTVYGPYPMFGVDGDGKKVPVVTTNGDYRYVGRLVVDFDEKGNVVEIDGKSGPVRVAGGDHPDAVAPLAEVEAQVTQPVARALASLKERIVASTEVSLDGRRSAVRSRETNEGDLIADAVLAKAKAAAPARRVPLADVALVNGGSIRNNSVLSPGPISEWETFDILPFPDVVTVVANVPAVQFKELLENSVSLVEQMSGRFAQVSGFGFRWSPSETPQQLDSEGRVTVPGSRVREVVLEDGTPIVRSGRVLAGAPSVNVATTDFLARGGDQYPYRGTAFVTLGVGVRKALMDFLQHDLNGVVRRETYPEGGTGRIVREDGR